MEGKIEIVIISSVLLVLAYVVFAYNRIVKLRNRVREAWGDIDVQLKKRRDLIPILSKAVSSYKGFERDTLESIVNIRRKADGTGAVKDRERLEREFRRELKDILVLFERYPQLRAADLYRELQDKLTEVEDNIQFARRYYNGAVRDYNTFISMFPNNVIARILGFKEAEFFEIEEGEREAPRISMGGEG